MAHIKITKGLDIPIKGKPEGKISALIPSGESSAVHPAQIALDLKPFTILKFKLLVKLGDVVKKGQPLVEDKASPGRFFVSPAGGIVKDIRRGLKRVLQDIIIDVAQSEEEHNIGQLDLQTASKEQILEHLKKGGAFAHIFQRPFNLLANPTLTPRHIFVKAIESAPFAPPAELQVAGHEKEFQLGLIALSKLTSGYVHLVHRHNTETKAFTEAFNVQKHTAEGPHPIGNHSVHIQHLEPIQSADDVIWTVNIHDVIVIGHLLQTGKYYTDKVISIAGPGILENRTGYFKVREGFPIASLIAGRIPKGELRFISGDPLMGQKVAYEDFLGFNDYVFCVIPENTEREFLHFFRLGTSKYTFSKAYLTGHLDNTHREYDFTTNQHGEHRAFIDTTLYDKVQPLEVPTILLVKSIMAEDFDLAQTLGILEVASEDFALPTFVCPSKIEMTEIVKNGLQQYANEVLV